MEILGIRIKWHQILVLIIIILGIGSGVMLLQRQQLIKSRATVTNNAWMNGFELKDNRGNPISCNTNTDPPECIIGDESSTIGVKDTNILNSYIQSL